MINGMSTLGERMAARREALALSQNRAAKLLGGSRTTWINWETGKSVPERFNYVRIETVLQWEPGSVEAVLQGRDPVARRKEHSPPAGPPPGWGIDPREWALYDPVDREMILNAIRIARRRAQAAGA